MDNQGQNKDMLDISHNQKGQSKNNPNIIDFLSYDTRFIYIYKKTEKLATALYMVTNLFAESEPMKWTLRSKVSNLLSFIISFKNIIQSREEEFSHNVQTSVLEIVSLLEICSKSGLVSTMNFGILKSEFINLIETLSQIKKTNYSDQSSMSLRKNFFDIEVDKFKLPLSKSENDKNPNNSVKDKNSSSDFPKKTNRQNIIVNLLKKSSNLTIKDIGEVVQNCSEKTIQRELVSLINSGIVKKDGERRWSKYSLV